MRGKANSATLIAGIISSETCWRTLPPGRVLEKEGNLMRSAVTAVLFALFLLAPGLVVQAQQVRLSDGTYASPRAYLEGTWKFDRPEPRQTMIMRFGRDGTF